MQSAEGSYEPTIVPIMYFMFLSLTNVKILIEEKKKEKKSIVPTTGIIPLYHL
jgi:hypothetical protein